MSSVGQTFNDCKCIKQDKLVYKCIEQTFLYFISIGVNRLACKNPKQTFLCFKCIKPTGDEKINLASPRVLVQFWQKL